MEHCLSALKQGVFSVYSCDAGTFSRNASLITLSVNSAFRTCSLTSYKLSVRATYYSVFSVL